MMHLVDDQAFAPRKRLDHIEGPAYCERTGEGKPKIGGNTSVSAEYITNNRKSRTLWETVWDSNPGSTV